MVSYAQNIVSYFAIIAALGLPTYGTREIAKASENTQNVSNIFWELFVINAMSTTISLIVYAFLILNIRRFYENLLLYLVAGMQIFLNYINVDWVYQGLEEYKFIAIRSAIVKLVALLLLPILIRSSDDYILYAFIYCLAIAGNNAFNIVRIRKYIVRKDKRLQLAKHLKPVAILLMASLAIEVYVMIDTTMLGVFCTDSVVGCYSNAMKLIRTINTSVAAIGAVLLPRLSYIYSKGDYNEFEKLVNMALKIMLIFAIPAASGVILLSKECVLVFFGESFIMSVSILRILALMIPIVVCNTILGAQVLVTANRERKYVVAVCVSAIVNACLNGYLIPRYGAASAAVASLLSEIIVLLLYLYFSKDIFKLKFGWSFWGSILGPIGIYIVISLLISKFIPMGNILTIVINVIICVIIYFGGGILLKNEAILFCESKIRGIISSKVKQ